MSEQNELYHKKFEYLSRTMKFDDYKISPKIKKGLDRLGFKRPTDIQYKCIPNILKGEDLLAIAQTGTGKTAAFAIPIIDMVYFKKQKQRREGGVKCLVITPTHELALQLLEVFEAIGRFTTVKTMAMIGGVDQDPQIIQLYSRVDIVIATPGRMFDLISQGHFRTEQIEILVLDEADHMLNLGFIKDIKDVLRKLPKRRQTLFFSATINPKIKKTAYDIVKQSAIRIQLSPEDPVSKNVDHSVLFVEMDHKRFFLERVIKENPDDKVLVFVRTKVRAERVLKAMERVEINGLTIHGDKGQKERSAVLEQFKSGDVNLLIATDVSARGLDIPDVSIVINYDLPEDSENYVHRVGRTGRGNNFGHAYSFCSPQERPTLNEIQTFIHKEIKVLHVDKKDFKKVITLGEQPEKTELELLMEEMESFEERKKNRRKKKKKK